MIGGDSYSEEPLTPILRNTMLGDWEDMRLGVFILHKNLPKVGATGKLAR